MELKKLLSYGVVARLAVAFSFKSRSEDKVTASPRNDFNLSPIEILQSGSRASDIYTVALGELQDLESEPLCHRIAARLLVGNCQLLDGKDEATMLTDSGRQVRDFVDSYAASMAICDLERGRISIPRTCEKFREPVLAQLPLADQARLHVTSPEIDLCLSGLATESSAWNTWVSYRHKALRFCEAARADQEKAQNIILYQRLTKVIAKLTYGVEIELQKHMENLERRVQNAGHVVSSLEPELDRLRDKLVAFEDYITYDLGGVLTRSSDSVNNSLHDAANLQKLIAVLIKTVLDSTSGLAASQEKSLQLLHQNNDGMDNWAAVMATAAATAISLNSQIEVSRLEVEALLKRQSYLNTGLERLGSMTDNLSSRYDDHTMTLNQAKNITNEILDTLEGVALNTANIERANASLFRGIDLASWMPYIISPVFTLLLGSYGLAPSALRNLALVALGEAVGFSASRLHIVTAPLMSLAMHHQVNNTTETVI